MSAPAKLSEGAERLEKALAKSLYGYPNAPPTEQDIARVIVTELGITPEMVENTQLYDIAVAEILATLLEVAGQ